MDMTERFERIAFQSAIRAALETPTVELAPVEATLIVDNFSSRCSACGGNADPTESTHVSGGRGGSHETGSWLADRNGCGAVFAKVDDPRGVFTRRGGEQ